MKKVKKISRSKAKSKKMAKTVAELIPVLVKEGREKAMSIYNAG